MINNISEAIPAAQAGDQEGLNYIYYNTYKDQYVRVYGNISNVEMAEKDKEKFIQDILKEAYEFIFANIKYVTNINQFDGWLVNVVDDIAARKVAELESDDDKSAVGGVIVGASAGAGAAVGGSAAGNVLNANAAAAVNTGAVGSQAGEMAGNAVGTATGKAMAGNGVAGSMTEAGVGKVAAGAGKAAGVGKAVAAAGTAGAAKGGIVGTIGFKIVCGVIAVGVAGGAVTGVIVNHKDKKNENEIGTTTEVTSENTTEVVSSETTEITTEETTEVTTEEVAYEPVADDKWSELLKGDLSKEEFQYMLSVGANIYYDYRGEKKLRNFNAGDINIHLLLGCPGVESTGYGKKGNDYYDYYDNTLLNRLISVLTDEDMTKANMGEVNGDQYEVFFPVSPADAVKGELVKSMYRPGDDMYVEFNYIEYSLSEAYDPSVQIIKTAVLRQKEDGKYQVYEILNGTIDDNFGDKVNKDTSTDKKEDDRNQSGSRYDMFTKTLQSIDTTQYEGEATYNTDEFRVTYQLYDVNGDGEDDLIINYPINDGQPFVNYGIDVYINKGDKLVKAKNEMGTIQGTLVFAEKGIFEYSYDRSNGDMHIYTVNYSNGTISSSFYEDSTYEQRTANGSDGGLGKYTGWGEEYDVPEYQMTDYSPFQ